MKNLILALIIAVIIIGGFKLLGTFATWVLATKVRTIIFFAIGLITSYVVTTEI